MIRDSLIPDPSFMKHSLEVKQSAEWGMIHTQEGGGGATSSIPPVALTWTPLLQGGGGGGRKENFTTFFAKPIFFAKGMQLKTNIFAVFFAVEQHLPPEIDCFCQ